MTPYLAVKETAAGVFEEIAPGASFTTGDVFHPYQVIELWSDAALAAIKVYRVQPAAVPDDKFVTSYTFGRQGGSVVKQIVQLADKPAQPVTPRQIRLALTQIGLRQAIEDWIQTQDITVKDNWDYALSFERNNPLILAAAAAMGKTEADVDALFALARTFV